MIHQLLATLVALTAATGLMSTAQAQDFPSRNIRLISPSAPGGPTDISARMVAEKLSAALKTNVIVENKAGAVGAIMLGEVAKAAPDGYTLGLTFVAGHVIHPLMNDKLQFNVRKDFTFVARISDGGNVVVVNSTVPVKNMKEFGDYVRALPQPPNYGSWGAGSHGHITMEFIKQQTGLKLEHVPYKSTTALATDMAGGHMMLGVLDSLQTATHVRSGKLRAIAIAGPRRIQTMPDVPTLAEQGINLTKGPWTAIIGPANMPKPVVAKLSAEIQRLLTEPDIRERFVTAFGEPPAPGSPEDVQKQFDSDWELWGKVIRDANIKM